jgi:hypothetical protein
MSTAAIVGGSIAAAGIGAVGASSAAGAQASAANNAAQLQYNLGQQGLAQNQQQWQQTQQNMQPWLQAGQGGLANLSYLMGTQPQGSFNYGPGGAAPGGGMAGPVGGSTAATLAGLTGPLGVGWNAAQAGGDSMLGGGRGVQPMSALSGGGMTGDYAARGSTNSPNPVNFYNPPGQVNTGLGGYGSLMQPWTQQFQAPTDVTEQNDPGYQFRLQQGQQALERSAAARGGLLSGGTGKALQQYGQDYASNEYGNVYNRALGQYQQNYNIFQQNQANQFNRLAALSGVGQTAAGQLSSAGQSYANTNANLLGNIGQQVGSNINNAGAARASGYVGMANALGGLGNTLSTIGLLNQLGGGYNPGNIAGMGSLPGSGFEFPTG